MSTPVRQIQKARHRAEGEVVVKAWLPKVIREVGRATAIAGGVPRHLRWSTIFTAGIAALQARQVIQGQRANDATLSDLRA